MSSTPIYDFVKQISDSTISRFFMPGHKGRHPFDPFFQDVSRYDITEIEGADVLAQAEGIIGESEELAATLFGSRATLYSTQGSTLGIQAMVSLISGRGDTVIAGRNAHMAFYNACLLLRINVRWVLPSHTDPYGICGAVTPDRSSEPCVIVRRRLRSISPRPITSAIQQILTRSQGYVKSTAFRFAVTMLMALI